MRSKLEDFVYDEKRNLPNRFTEAMGELIRKAREEANLSQEELARLAYLKQSSISKVESGIRAVSTEDLLYISHALNKPVTYFFPKKFVEEMAPKESKILEEELIIQVRRLDLDDLRKLIAQARALAELENGKGE